MFRNIFFVCLDLHGKNSLKPGEFDLPGLKYRNSNNNQLNTIDINNLSHLNEPEILSALRTRYHKNVLSCYVGRVLVHINPLRAAISPEEKATEFDSVLEEFALGVKNQTSIAPDEWELAYNQFLTASNNGGVGGTSTGGGPNNKNQNLFAAGTGLAQQTQNFAPALSYGGGGLVALLQDYLDPENAPAESSRLSARSGGTNATLQSAFLGKDNVHFALFPRCR